MNNNLQRMIVVPPEVFDKWKHIIIEDENLTKLDKAMKTILYNKNINNVEKWHHYRENLLKHSFANKKGIKNFKNTPKITTTENSMQTKRIIKYDKSEQTDVIPKTPSPQRAKQTIEDEVPFDNEEIFETEDATSSEESISDEEIDVDDETRELALKGSPYDIKIVKERKSMNPSEYRTFELSNSDVVSVPISKVITRSMIRHNRKATEVRKRSPTKSKQQTLQFKKIKKIKIDSSKAKTPQKNEQKWQEYK